MIAYNTNRLNTCDYIHCSESAFEIYNTRSYQKADYSILYDKETQQKLAKMDTEDFLKSILADVPIIKLKTKAYLKPITRLRMLPFNQYGRKTIDCNKF